MAEPQIPPPGAGGYWHFLYITRESGGRYYGGKRSSKRYPTSDPYLGSGKWVTSYPDRKRLKREIVAFYATSAEAFAAEAEMITWTLVAHDPFCMNEWVGGRGISSEVARRLALLRCEDPEFIARLSAGGYRQWKDNIARRKEMSIRRLSAWADPEQHARWCLAAQERCSKPEFSASMTAAAHQRWANPEFREKMAAISGSPEVCAKQSAGQLRVWADPEYRANRLASQAAKRAAKIAAGVLLRTDTVYVTMDGKQVPLVDACLLAGVLYRTAKGRRARGWPEKEWLLPLGTKKRAARRRPSPRPFILITLNGERVRLKEACRRVGVHYQTAIFRRKNGLPESQWLTPPRTKRTAR